MKMIQFTEAQAKQMFKDMYGSWSIGQIETLKNAGYIKQSKLEEARELKGNPIPVLKSSSSDLVIIERMNQIIDLYEEVIKELQEEKQDERL
jgi:hypothetical protein